MFELWHLHKYFFFAAIDNQDEVGLAMKIVKFVVLGRNDYFCLDE
jgi:hypothetical protein